MPVALFMRKYVKFCMQKLHYCKLLHQTVESGRQTQVLKAKDWGICDNGAEFFVLADLIIFIIITKVDEC